MGNKYSGTKTEKNLMDAFAGESQARNKYTYFASVAKKEGYEAAVCFVVQMEGVKYLEPNDDTHPEFGQALRRAAAGGVEVLAFACRVKPDAVVPAETVPVILGED